MSELKSLQLFILKLEVSFIHLLIHRFHEPKWSDSALITYPNEILLSHNHTFLTLFILSNVLAPCIN